MAAKLKVIPTKLKPWHKRKQSKKAVTKSRARRTVRFAVIGCSALILLAVLGLGLLAFADRNDNVPTKLSSNATPSNTQTATTTPSTSQGSSATTTPTTTTSKSAPSTSLTQQLNQANAQYTCTTFDTNMKYNYQTNVNELATNLGNDENTAYTDASQQGWSFTTLVNTVNSDITNINGTISQDWNTSFTGTSPSGCGSIPGVPSLLQVPSCDATDAGGISSCISQIDTSLNI
jgi:cytoskeletal protein RodZ